ncbi:prevent-host-death family protein [Streptomyces sp. TRM68416]|nr:prevent-host-death family protein [Streptomyces sp. TRM68416]
MVLTTAIHAERTEENLTTAARLFLALLKQDDGAKSLLLALPEVFPWVRHLDAEEVQEFTVELLEALSDAAELGARDSVHRAIVSWRATARINADPDQLREALRPLGDVDLGPVEVHE